MKKVKGASSEPPLTKSLDCDYNDNMKAAQGRTNTTIEDVFGMLY